MPPIPRLRHPSLPTHPTTVNGVGLSHEAQSCVNCRRWTCEGGCAQNGLPGVNRACLTQAGNFARTRSSCSPPAAEQLGKSPLAAFWSPRPHPLVVRCP